MVLRRAEVGSLRRIEDRVDRGQHRGEVSRGKDPPALARSDLGPRGPLGREQEPGASVGLDDGTQLATDHQRWAQPPRRLVKLRWLKEMDQETRAQLGQGASQNLAVRTRLVGDEDAEAGVGVVDRRSLSTGRPAGPRGVWSSPTSDRTSLK